MGRWKTSWVAWLSAMSPCSVAVPWALTQVHLFGAQVRVRQSQTDGLGHGLLLGLGDVGAVGVGAEAQHFRVDPGAARQGMIPVLQDEGAAALAHHQAVAVRVEGARRGLGRVVLQAGGVQRVEDGGGVDGQLVATPGDHHGLLALLDGLVGVADGLAAGRAGGAGGDDAAREAEEDADVHGSGVAHGLDVAGGADAADASHGEALPQGHHGFHAAEGGAVGHAGAAAAQDGIAQQARVGQGQLGGADAQQGHAPHGTHHLAGVVLRHLEVLDGDAEAGLDLGVLVPGGHGLHAAAAGLHGRADGLPAVPQGRDAAHAGHDHATHQTSPPFTPSTWRVM